MEFFLLLLVLFVAAIGIACAIHYFFDSGPWVSLGYGFFAVAIFLFFAASGIWENAQRYDWGRLAPVFALMLAGGWVGIRYGRRIWHWGMKRKNQSGK